ncbi:hypothetical protein pb186bvf_015762 [Paramecium bursaria]
MKNFSQKITNVRQYQIAENQQLGQGVYGSVCKAWCSLIPDKLFCAKIIEINNTDRVMMINELEIMVAMTRNKHINLVQILDAFLSDDERCYIIMEQQESNLLSDFKVRIDRTKWYTFDEVSRIIRDLLYGLFELHNNNIIHRNLKPSNILIGSDYMISGFRFCKKLNDQLKNLQIIEGSVKYFCPQIYEKYIINGKIANYTQKSDIYSLGVIFYQLAFGGSFPWQENIQKKFYPWEQNIQKKFHKELKKGNFEVKQPQLQAQPLQLEELRLLLEKMLKYKEEDRPGWLELLTHPVVINQNQVVQMNQTSYTKLVFNTILDQLKNTIFFTIKNDFLNEQLQNLLNNDQNSQNKLYVLIIIQITKCQVAEIQYELLKQKIHEMEDLYKELIHIAILAYVGFVYDRLQRCCFGYQNDIQYVYELQMNPEIMKLMELIKQQYLNVKVLLINYSEKLLQLNKGQFKHQEYQQLIEANENGYYQLFQRSLSDFLAIFQFDQIWVKKLNYILNLENQYPLDGFMNQSIEVIQNI